MTWGFGKVILLGEHAVVHGHPALAGALSRGVRARAEAQPGPTRLVIQAWDVDVTTEGDGPLSEALRALLAAARAKPDGLALSAEVSIPPAAGLGSSAALGVALARAITAALGRDASDAEIETIAGASERCFHGNPSGIDVALATRGGLGLFRRGEGLRAIEAEPVPLAIGLSGEPRRTADMVARVARALERDPAARGQIDRLGDYAARGAEALAGDSADQLGPLMCRAHEALATLGVSTASLDRMVDAAMAAGAAGAKLTGAGGGGAVIAYAPGEEETVCDAWRALGYDALVCRAGTRRDPGSTEES